MNPSTNRQRPFQAGQIRKNEGSQPEDINVGETERMLSLFGGGVFVACGLLRGSLTMAAVGGALAYRGFTGHCHAYTALGHNTAEPVAETPRLLIPGEGL